LIIQPEIDVICIVVVAVQIDQRRASRFVHSSMAAGDCCPHRYRPCSRGSDNRLSTTANYPSWSSSPTAYTAYSAYAAYIEMA
jgi:hypothetical protein